ncbi:hypothetical protein J7F01_38290 [Streptomyces sp. ISL-22]|uniref:TetR family transcriptional regulator C-terminal domain-containing protein n=1 Tax=unclassified Streptomyces TaxID=2593676 RepID=UPI001BE83476|nr:MULTISPECIES: hypothetical protein [unclassified Streptomyces]MBT2423744.1 hypothetical protein [Streptomyces sp. ISL-24]MBT2437881.1 hypothetical protein [Streptomyces sp. ISL-22]
MRAGVCLALDQGAAELDRDAAFRAWTDRLARVLADARDQGELLPHSDVTDTAEFLTGAFAGVQAMSQARCDRADLGHRVPVLLRHVLPRIATPAVPAALDLSPERGERVFDKYAVSASANTPTSISSGPARWRQCP